MFKRDPALTDTEKKADVLRYLDYDLEQVWRTIPEYDTLASTYEQFKAAVYVYYPNSTGDFVYSMHEKEAHIQKYKDEGINSADDLQRFHLRWSMRSRTLQSHPFRVTYLISSISSIHSFISSHLILICRFCT